MRKEIISFDIGSWLSEACKHSNRLFSSMEIVVPVDLENPADQLCRKVAAMSHTQPWQIKPEGMICFMVTMPLVYELTLADLDRLCSTIQKCFSCSPIIFGVETDDECEELHLKIIFETDGAAHLNRAEVLGANKFTTMAILLSNK